ncbi:MAG: nuclear transport factor 2 family protein [Acidobacteria bacterium]|nr:nuclear transport factor 2 family protein [Acidobacteriota bacterium]MYH30885.1 nuclear transport factor 2 family protein [Acidobacteriota bacterium]
MGAIGLSNNGKAGSHMMRSIGAVLLSLATGSGALIAAEQSSPGLSWEDHVEIQALYATYAHSLDSGDADTWAETFTPDGVLLMVAAGDTEDAGLRIAGRDALAGFATGAYAANGGDMRNWQSQAMITATPGGAEGRCDLVLFRTVDGPAAIQTSGAFTDRLVQTAVGWRFAHRTLRGDGPAQR